MGAAPTRDSRIGATERRVVTRRHVSSAPWQPTAAAGTRGEISAAVQHVCNIRRGTRGIA